MVPCLKIFKLVGRQKNKCLVAVYDCAVMECSISDKDRELTVYFPDVQRTGSVVVSRALG